MSPKHRRPICSIVHVQIHPCSQSMKALLSQSQTQGNLTVLNAPQSWHCLRTWSIGLTPTPTCGSAEANVRSQVGSSWNPPATSPVATAQQSCITWREDWRLAIPGRSAQPTTVDRHEKTINRGFLEELPHTQRKTGGHKLVIWMCLGYQKGFHQLGPRHLWVTAIKISHPNLIHCGQYDFSCYVHYVQVQDGTSTSQIPTMIWGPETVETVVSMAVADTCWHQDLSRSTQWQTTSAGPLFGDLPRLSSNEGDAVGCWPFKGKQIGIDWEHYFYVQVFPKSS